MVPDLADDKKEAGVSGITPASVLPGLSRKPELTMSLMTTTIPESLGSPIAPRARSPRVTKAASRQVASKPRKVSFYLSDEAIRRLGSTATMEGTDKSRVVERLVTEGLRRWGVSDRAKPTDQATEGVSSD